MQTLPSVSKLSTDMIKYLHMARNLKRNRNMIDSILVFKQNITDVFLFVVNSKLLRAMHM